MSAMNFSGAVALSSTFAYVPASCVTYVDDCAYVPLQEEAAGKIGKYLAVAAAIIVPFAAPAVFGAIAGSGVLGASMAAAASSAGFMGTMAGIVGSAVTGGVMSAAAAFAGGARGGDVWAAFATGGLGSGFSAFRAGQAVNAASQAVNAGAGALGGGTTTAGLTVPGSVTAGAGSVAAGVPGAAAASTVSSPNILQSIGNMIPGVSGNPEAMNRIGAMLINAVVNGQRMGNLDGLVEQQRAELEALRIRDQAAYDTRITEARKLLQEADRMDPQWWARLAMADVAGMEEKQFNQTMRNIAVRQGGSLDDGQMKAYERKQKLHTARSKALAANQAYISADTAKSQRTAQAVGLMGPDTASFANLNAQHQLQNDAFGARAHFENEAWSGILEGMNRPNTGNPESGVPDEEDEDDAFAGLRTG